MRGVLVVALALGLTAANATLRADEDPLMPAIPKAEGERCVADIALMRREHMNLLSHECDDTMRKGIRKGQFSLKECLVCHAAAGPDGKAVSAESPRHFCRACHDYAAVRVDCFECHASRPGEAAVVRRAVGPLYGLAGVRSK